MSMTMPGVCSLRWDVFFATNCTANLNRTCHVDIMAAHIYTPCDVSALQKCDPADVAALSAKSAMRCIESLTHAAQGLRRLVDEISWKYNKPIFITGALNPFATA